MNALLKLFGFCKNKEDERIKNLVSNSYPSVKVVGRGTVTIDAREVRNSAEFKSAIAQAKAIVDIHSAK